MFTIESRGSCEFLLEHEPILVLPVPPEVRGVLLRRVRGPSSPRDPFLRFLYTKMNCHNDEAEEIH